MDRDDGPYLYACLELKHSWTLRRSAVSLVSVTMMDGDKKALVRVCACVRGGAADKS